MPVISWGIFRFYANVEVVWRWPLVRPECKERGDGFNQTASEESVYIQHAFTAVYKMIIRNSV